MKIWMPLFLALSASSFVACTHDSATADSSTTTTTSTTDTAEPSAREGWSDVKSGTKEAARGTGEVAKAAGNSVVEGTKELGRDIKSGAKEAAHDVKATACPVLGNKTTKVFYTKVNKSYDSLLSGKNALPSENRECFMNEANAREAGFHSAN